MLKRWDFYIQLCLILLISATVCFAAEENAVVEPLLTLSCKSADIRDVLRGVAMQYGINIVPDSNVTGSVTIHLQNAPFETGLATLLETNGYEYEKRDGIYLVRAKDSTVKPFEMSLQDGKLTVDAENADIGQLLRELSKLTSLNIVTESGLTGNVTVHLSDVPVEDALYSILTANGFVLNDIRHTGFTRPGQLLTNIGRYRMITVTLFWIQAESI